MNNKQLNQIQIMKWIVEVCNQEHITPKQLIMDYNVEILSKAYYKLENTEWLELI